MQGRLFRESQLVQDAVRHGVEVRSIDVCASDWDCTLEHPSPVRPEVPIIPSLSKEGPAHPAVRLGLRLVSTLPEAAAERLTQARRVQGFASVDDLARRLVDVTPWLGSLATHSRDFH